MSDTLFQNIIKEVPANKKYHLDEDTERLIIYRPRTDEYLYETSFMDRFFNQSDKHFIVKFDQFEKIEKLECEIFDHGTTIKLMVTFTIGCTRAKAAKLVKLVNKSKDLKETLRGLFVNWTNSFVDSNHTSIKKNFTEIDGNLRRFYEKYAESRGLRLQIIRIDLDPDLDKFLNGFSFVTDDDEFGVSENKFNTKEDDVKIKLRINIEGKGESLKGNLTKYIGAKLPLIGQIKLQTIEFVKKWMRKISPEDLYMADRDKKLEELNHALTLFYKEEFNVFNPSFDFTSLDTKLKIRFDELSAENGRFIIEDVTSTIKYEIIYSVSGVVNWRRFILHQKKYFGNSLREYSDLSEILKNEMEMNLNQKYGMTMAGLKSSQLIEGIKNLFEMAVNNTVAIEYGLSLNSPHLKRFTIEREKLPRNVLMEKYKMEEANVDRLLDKLWQAKANDDFEKAIELEKELDIVQENVFSIKKQLGPLDNIDPLTNNLIDGPEE